MSFVVAFLGLAFVIFVHEVGHFYAARAVRMRPRSFNIGFGPAIAKVRRAGIEYAIRPIPLGGYVKIPGMVRPQASDVDVHLGSAMRNAPELVGPAERLKRALSANDLDQARSELESLAEVAASADARGVERGVAELRDSLSHDAYWRQPIWRRIVSIAAGPAANVALAVVLFATVFLTSSPVYRLGFLLKAKGAEPTRVVESVIAHHPAAIAGLRSGDVIVAIDGRPVTPSGITTAIRSSKGSPVVLTVRRNGDVVQIGPARARKEEDYSAGEALWQAVALSGRLTREVVLSLGNIVHQKGRDEIASPVGIIDESRKGAERGWQTYVVILGFVSLSLGLLNLLPLLPLDGGHIMFAVVEKLRGHAIRREIYERVSAVGIALVLVLFFVGLSNDVNRLGGG